MLYVDIPTRADLLALADHRDGQSVSLYLPTTPLTQDAAADRIALKNLVKEALHQLEAAGADKRRLDSLIEHFEQFEEDEEFWRFQARSLAIFATPDNVRTFRVPNTLHAKVEVSDRFDLTSLFRAVTFPNVAYVLALSEGAVRVVEISPDLPATTLKLSDMPRDAASAAGKSSLNNLSNNTRLQGSTGKKFFLGQYARMVDRALRPLLAGSDIPLILASTEPLASIYRSVNSYSHLAGPVIGGNPDHLTDAQLSDQARAVLDALARTTVEEWGTAYRAADTHGRATADIAHTARAATFGAVDSLLLDIDATVLGTVSDADGAVSFADHASAGSYDILGEIGARVIRAGGRVLGVRKGDIPAGSALAAILRYPV